MTILMTTYLTGRPHPITKKWVKPDDPDRLKLFYPGLVKFGLQALIFYDHLTADFISQYETDRVRFVRSEEAPRGWSNNDWRFRLYFDWLLAHQEQEPEPVFFVDMFDTQINRDPAQVIAQGPEYEIWSATDRRTPVIEPGTKDGDWIVTKLKACYADAGRPLWGKTYYTAALLGGRRGEMVSLANLLVDEMSSILATRPDVNCNMGAVNRVLHEHFAGKLYPGGPPLHSQPCTHDLEADVAFVHK